MKTLVFLLFLMVGGCIGFLSEMMENCDMTKCEDISPMDDFRMLMSLPNKDQLDILCPKTLRYFDCERENIEECSGLTVEEIAASPNKSAAEIATAALVIGRLVVDLCDADTSLHRDYVASVECFNNLVAHGPRHTCKQEGEEVAKGFLDNLERLGEDTDDGTRRCLERAYTMACASTVMEQHCGAAARRAFVAILRTIKTLPAIASICSTESAATLRGRFLEHLNFEEQQRDVYLSIFSSLRRRR